MWKISRESVKSKLVLSLAFILLATLVPFDQVRAANLHNKSVIIGSVQTSAVTNHKFQFDLNTSGAIGSMAFEYCESPLFDVSCDAPSGLDASGAVLSAETGQIGFSIHPNTVSNRIVITRPPALASGTVSYDFTNIVNPDTPNHTTFIRITTYSNIDATGPYVDGGAVAFSIVPSLGINVFVPPYLTFCTGVTVALKCESSSGLNIDLGTLKSTQTAYTSTQFAGATNDDTGYSVSVLGTTMTSGNNQIKRLATQTGSIPGLQQFGINLRNNSSPNIGHNREGSGSLSVISAYNSPNSYKFASGDVLSSTGSATEFNRMTVSYIVNIESGQPPGIYSTTLTYVAMASF